MGNSSSRPQEGSPAWANHPTRSTAVVMALMKAICAAVDAAHAAGVTHRDLKPGNVAVDKDDTPYVLDFGVASLDDDRTIGRTFAAADPEVDTPGGD